MAARSQVSLARRLVTVSAIGVGLAVSYATTIAVLAPKIIYFRRAYTDYGAAKHYEHERSLVPIQDLTYQTSQGRQVAFYVPLHAQCAAEAGTAETSEPEILWLFFGGNAAVALDWVSFLLQFKNMHPEIARKSSFLLVDYPGYGRCEGVPSPPAILESVEAALKLIPKFNHIRVVGHSLGAAVGTLVATHVPVQRLVLISPFTSISRMSLALLGGLRLPFLARLLGAHKMDNEQQLREVLQKLPQVDVRIVHGSADEIVPVEMGRALARALPVHTNYVEVKCKHNDIFDCAGGLVLREMTAPLPRL